MSYVAIVNAGDRGVYVYGPLETEAAADTFATYAERAVLERTRRPGSAAIRKLREPSLDDLRESIETFQR